MQVHFKWMLYKIEVSFRNNKKHETQDLESSTPAKQSFRNIKYFSLNLNKQSWNLYQIFPKSGFSFFSCS